MFLSVDCVAGFVRGTVSLWRRGALVAVAGLAIAIGSSHSYAQMGPGGGGRGGFAQTTILNEKQVEHYYDMLSMTKDQREAAGSLYEGYRDELKRLQEQQRTMMDEARQKFQQDQDPSVFQDMQKKMTELRTKQEDTQKSFLSDVKSLLTPDQTSQFDKVERAIRRDTTMRRGRMSGEGVDLIEFVSSQKWPDELKSLVRPALDAYEEEIDRALVLRNAAYEKVGEAMRAAFQDGDRNAADGAIKAAREASQKVRDTNRKYMRQVMDLIPESERTSFADAFKRASFPDVYRPSLASQSFEAVLGFSDLTTEQKDKIVVMQGAYDKKMSSLNDRLAAATEEMENNFDLQRGMQMMRGGGGDEVTNEIRTDRRELNTQALDELKKVLTPEQVARMPKPDPQSQDQGGRQRGMRGGGPGGGPGGPGGGNRGGGRRGGPNGPN